jgi:hypothetical protein
MKNGSGDNHDDTAFKGEALLHFSVNCVGWGLCFPSFSTREDQHVSYEYLKSLPLCILQCTLIRIDRSYG